MGGWLYEKNALLGVLPKATLWLRDVHKARIKIDLAHAKDQKTGANTRPVSFKEADGIFKLAQQAWAELIAEWTKIL